MARNTDTPARQSARRAPKRKREADEEDRANKERTNAAETPTSLHLQLPAPFYTRIHLTEDYVRSLLPGALFGHADAIWAAGRWSLERERALIDEHIGADAGRLQRLRHAMAHMSADGAQRLVAAELRLWEVVQHRFRGGLDDLFRYGLKPDFQGSCRRPHALADYCDKLTAILVHPIWRPSDLAPVRWLLQRAVQVRVPGHPRPVVPPYSHWRAPFVDTARQWASAASMRRAGEDAEAAAAQAAQAAQAAEAEMAWFLFSANTPRDFWYLDQCLDMGTDENEDDDDDDDDDSVTSVDPPASELSICSAIRNGCFGDNLSPVGEFGSCCARRQREDRQAERRRRRGDPAPDPSTVLSQQHSTAPDEHVFFYLQSRDLDRVLQLLAQPDFMEHSGFAASSCYLQGYFQAHAQFGYGHGDGPAPRLCHQCAQEYHQGHEHQGHPPEHPHHFHQKFVGDVPPHNAGHWLLRRKCEWLLAGRREEQLRVDTLDTLDMLDIPPFDPDPLAHLDAIFTDAASPAAVDGRRQDAHASKLWCFWGVEDG